MNRRFFRAPAVLMICIGLAVAGCQQPASSTTDPKTAPPAEQTSKPVDENPLVIFSWWTAGGEADGLNELIRLFVEQNPDRRVVNAAVAGGAGTNAKAVLKTRMLGGEPPGTFQVHGGAELLETWVKPNLMAPVTSLYDEMGWRDHFPAKLIEMVSRGGEIYAVPSNVHRGNMLWYNKALFDQHNISLPTTFDELIGACGALKKAGVTPFALGSRNKWPVLHLFENLLLVAGGVDFYTDLFAGKIAWTDERVRNALKMLAQLIDFSNTDHGAMTWDQACGMVLQGKAAMTVMGDWANGYFLSQGVRPGEQYDAIPTPGTAGHFFVITDTFGLPAKLADKKATLNFLKVVGSVEGQLAFNLKKGSIPARTDLPTEQFDAISKTTLAGFSKDTLVPSCAHGSAVFEGFVTELNDQLSVFVVEKNIDNSAKALEFAAKDAGLRK